MAGRGGREGKWGLGLLLLLLLLLLLRVFYLCCQVNF